MDSEVKEDVQQVEHPAVPEQRDGRPGYVDADLAADFLAQYNGDASPITPEESDNVRRKIDLYLLPIICYIYFSQQLDKSSLAFSSLFGVITDAKLVGQDYSWLSSIVYFAQLVFQPLSVYALVRFPVNYWISGCFLAWGITLTLMTACTSFTSLAIMRFLLGGFEASISPSMIILVSMWWTRREQPFRNNIWYACNAIAATVGSLLAYGLAQAAVHTVLHPYQLIFLVSGVLSVSLAIPTWFIFPRHPAQAYFLDQRQRFIAVERIRMNNTGTQNTHFKWAHVREAMLDPKAWIYVLMIFSISVVSGGISSFGGLILQGFGLTTFQTILWGLIPQAVSLTGVLFTGWLISSYKLKGPVMFVASLFPLAGAIALFVLPRGPEERQKLMATYFILNLFGCITPILFSWCFANTAGHTKKTTMTAMLYIGLCTGNIVGPQLYKTTEAPYYLTGLKGNMVCLIALSLLIAIQMVYLAYLNRRNKNRRRAAGKVVEIVDLSLEKSSKWEELRERQAEFDAAEGKNVDAGHGQQAFLDLTDLQNDEFIYSI